jgi:hypothetical protein
MPLQNLVGWLKTFRPTRHGAFCDAIKWDIFYHPWSAIVNGMTDLTVEIRPG